MIRTGLVGAVFLLAVSACGGSSDSPLPTRVTDITAGPILTDTTLASPATQPVPATAYTCAQTVEDALESPDMSRAEIAWRLIFTTCTLEEALAETSYSLEDIVALVQPGCQTDAFRNTAICQQLPPVDSTATLDLSLVDGQLEGGSRRETVDLGSEVTVRVQGGSEETIHIHGYDLFIELVEGQGEVTFTAQIPGVFEIKVEQTGTLLLQMEVS